MASRGCLLLGCLQRWQGASCPFCTALGGLAAQRLQARVRVSAQGMLGSLQGCLGAFHLCCTLPGVQDQQNAPRPESGSVRE